MFAVVAGVLAAVISLAPAAQAVTGPRAACADDGPGTMRCFSTVVPGSAAQRRAGDPQGWGADDLASAYRLPNEPGPDPVVGISIAFDAPDLEQDLNTYRAQYGLAPCTSANGCLRKVNQDGAPGPLPAHDFGWALESTLDVSMVSAACPSCRILVVEANSDLIEDLAASEDTAARLGATVVSNSYGARETGFALSFASHYEHPGVTTVASSGDSGFTAAEYPAALATAVAVGGTTLTEAPDTARGWSESAWVFGGSGCSAYVAKPQWQKDTHCGNRTVADVSAVADGLAMYDTEFGGWVTVGGTSASSPFVAGLIGRSGHAGTLHPADLYANASQFTDITTGNNDEAGGGHKCGGDYLCVAGLGYDAPTGVGVPNGLAGF